MLRGNLQPEEEFTIFRQLDTNKNGEKKSILVIKFLGVVYFDECAIFFTDFKTANKSDYLFFVLNLAREL